jgi:phage terminase large subunit-like protein
MSILHDPWELCDALDYRGGSRNFSQIHFEMMDEFCSPQLDDYAYASKFMKVSRGHLKSTLLILYILWRIYRNPNIRILYSTNTKDLSRSFVREVRQYFENAELQEKVWNVREHIAGNMIPSLDAHSRRRRAMSGDNDTEAEDKKIIWSREAIQVIRSKKLKEPTLVAGSVLSTNTGEHYDLIINDDAVDFQNSDNEDKADKIKDWAMDAFSVLDPPIFDQITPSFGEWLGNSMYVIGTPYYPWDYYSFIEQNAATLKFCTFEANIYANGVDNEDGYTYPEKFNDAYIESLMGRMSRKKFFAQYLLRHISDDEVVLDEGMLNMLAPAGVHFSGDGYATVNTGGVQKRIRLFMAVDPSSGKKAGRVDNTAIAIGGQDDLMNVYIVHLFAQRVLTSETVKQIYELCARFGIIMCNVLIRGVGELLPHAITRERTTYNRNIVVKPVHETGDKKTRITNALQPVIKLNKFFTFAWIINNTPLTKEIRQHPEGKQDDCLDVISAIIHLSTPTRQRTKGDKDRCRHLKINRRYGGSL